VAGVGGVGLLCSRICRSTRSTTDLISTANRSRTRASTSRRWKTASRIADFLQADLSKFLRGLFCLIGNFIIFEPPDFFGAPEHRQVVEVVAYPERGGGADCQARPGCTVILSVQAFYHRVQVHGERVSFHPKPKVLSAVFGWSNAR